MLAPEFDNDRVTFESSSKPRCIDSAYAFMQGMFPINSSILDNFNNKNDKNNIMVMDEKHTIISILEGEKNNQEHILTKDTKDSTKLKEKEKDSEYS